ncbi:MAG: hypothetical protein HYY06_31275 [Deltaproteobacteria bacterium]|nr:hypothetical protein [Deltaproteobacteria bacterium]
MIEEKRYFCHKCRQEIVFEVKMARTDGCPHCGVDLHCCKNCKYWDVSAHNQCKEHITEYITDRERANYCTFFEFNVGEREADQTSSARVKLDALFKKK